MADYRRNYDADPRREDRNRGERDEARPWFADGTYRTDDRDLHERYRERYRDEARGYRDRNESADEYYRAARDQRDDYGRWSAQSGAASWGDEGRSHSHGSGNGLPWTPRERGGYWRQYEGQNYPGQDYTGPNYAGRGPKDYQRSDDRVREEISDCMTDDPRLDASEITVEVKQGVVTLCGSVTSRDQKRRAEDVAERISGVKDVSNQLRVTREPNGHNGAADFRAYGAGTSSQPVTEGSGKRTPSKSSDNSA
jgi:hypothetical protein